MTSLSADLSAENLSLIARISDTIDRLRQLTQLDVQSEWRFCLADLSIAEVLQFQQQSNPGADSAWSPVTLNDRHHIAWSRGRQVLWLTQKIAIPLHLPTSPFSYPLQNLRLRLALTWWAELAQIYVNGKLVQEGDLFDIAARIVLSAAAQPGDEIDVAIRLVSPGHDEGALVRSRCIYECADQRVSPSPEPGFVADELAVLQAYCTEFAPEQLAVLDAAVLQLNWSVLANGDSIDRPAFDQNLMQLRRQLEPLSAWIKERKIYLLGHAHLDLAWLWTIAETWDAAERTFNSVLHLQQQFPELIFGHSTPALYEWVEHNRPQLFEQIQAQIQNGRWEVIAGLWVEPELNTLSGESIARQVLYGQRYAQAKLGGLSQVAWLPDSFGFSWQLPQILRQGGVNYFVTQKLRWNDTTQFPHDLFWWRSPDGSQILSLHSAPIGEQIDPLKMAQYACDWEAKTGLRSALWLPGAGDHGGGPTQDMLEVARRWQQSPFFPQVEFGTATQFLDRITPSPALPVWNDELYLEFHRGCYTTHADQKLWNRRCEDSLYQAELFASIAMLITGKSYPQAELENAWKNVLFNQFHDILPGSAIAPVYEDANPMWRAAYQTSERVVKESLQSIASQIELPQAPHENAQVIVVFNPLGWSRSQAVEWHVEQVDAEIRQRRRQGQPINLDQVQRWQVCDLAGQEVTTQSRFPWQLTFLAEDVPAFGYRCFWLLPTDENWKSSEPDLTDEAERYVLENDWLRVAINPKTGDLASVWDRVNQRQVLSGAGNQLQAFADQGQYWDAWNIDPSYAEHPLDAVVCLGVFPETAGAIETRIRMERKIGESVFSQTYILQRHSPVLQIATTVDWHEKHILVKAAFPLNLNADFATYEIPFGAIQRSTRPETEHDKTKWEVPALQWADLTDASQSFGVSLLNDCKYGYDAQPQQLRLTLLRGAEWPDPNADRGSHSFTYALYPHCDRWQSAQTTRHAYELNQPLRVLVWQPKDLTKGKLATEHGEPARDRSPLLPTGQFLNLQAENLIVTAFKPAEDPTESNSHDWILRCYECHGESATLTWGDGWLNDQLAIDRPQRTNLLEQQLEQETEQETMTIDPADASAADPVLTIKPWQIATFRFEQKFDSSRSRVDCENSTLN